MRWSAASLVGASWISAAAFALYILAFYLGAIPASRLSERNDNLPGLYAKGHGAAFVAMNAHMPTCAIVLLCGRWPHSIDGWDASM